MLKCFGFSVMLLCFGLGLAIVPMLDTVKDDLFRGGCDVDSTEVVAVNNQRFYRHTINDTTLVTAYPLGMHCRYWEGEAVDSFHVPWFNEVMMTFYVIIIAAFWLAFRMAKSEYTTTFAKIMCVLSMMLHHASHASKCRISNISVFDTPLVEMDGALHIFRGPVTDGLFACHRNGFYSAVEDGTGVVALAGAVAFVLFT